jgi:hypothetical protein
MAVGDEILCRVLAILMPLETERDLCLTLSAEANDLVQVLIWLRIRSIGTGALDHLGPLLQNGARLNLIHQDAFAFKRVTHWTSHSLLFSPILGRRQKGSIQKAH